MSHIVVDTDVASQLLRGRLAGPLAARLAGKKLAVSFVTVGELEHWRLVRQWGSRRMAARADFYRRVVVLPYDRQVAKGWGALQADAQVRGRR